MFFVMNRLQTIGLFAGIFAIAMGAISLNDTSESFFMVSATPQSQDNFGMLGHVEYTVRDESGTITSYMQTDNIVTDAGKDCVAKGMFDSADVAADDCDAQTAEFNYIAIGNYTAGTPDGLETSLDEGSTATNGCASVGAAATKGGEMWRLPIDPTFTSAAGSTIVTLDTVSNPFDFTGNNATIVFQSGVFNGAATHSGVACTDSNKGSTDMFAIQELATSVGITVSDGDSLSVKWTITIDT
jgi:hypothetical protein